MPSIVDSTGHRDKGTPAGPRGIKISHTTKLRKEHTSFSIYVPMSTKGHRWKATVLYGHIQCEDTAQTVN